MRGLRQAIVENRLQEFVNEFMKNWFNGAESIPGWVCEALAEAKVEIV